MKTRSAARLVAALLMLSAAALAASPTVVAETCESTWYATSCVDCPGPGDQEDCTYCYASDNVACTHGPGCETYCYSGPCRPGDTQGEVYECTCDGNECHWTQVCDDANQDDACDAVPGGGGGATGCTRICVGTRGLPLP